MTDAPTACASDRRPRPDPSRTGSCLRARTTTSRSPARPPPVGEGLRLFATPRPRRRGHRRAAARRHRPRPGQGRSAPSGHDTGIVVLTMYAGDEQLFAALEAGASAFVAKDAPSDEVVAAARHALVSPRSLHCRRPGRRDAASDDPERPTAHPARGRGAQPARTWVQRLRHRSVALRQRLDGQDAHLEDLREARCVSNRADAIMKAVRSGLLATISRRCHVRED